MKRSVVGIATVATAVALVWASGRAQAQFGTAPQVLIDVAVVEIGTGASRSAGTLAIDFNNSLFNDENRSFSTVRGFLAMGLTVPGPAIGSGNVVFGARGQIFPDPEVFDIHLDLPQLPNDRVRITGTNMVNFTPFIGIDLPIGPIIRGLEAQSIFRVFAGPTISDQGVHVDHDSNGIIQRLTFEELTVSPTIGLELVRTRVLVRDGQTVLLGGIKAGGQVTFQRGVPRLADLPGLGALFKQERKADVSANLMIFVTPRIVRGTE